MRYSLFHLDREQAVTLQAQIKEMLVTAMLSGQLAAGASIPSTRAMARRLNVSRNTVMAAYQALAADGYLQARERSGFYVAPRKLPEPEHEDPDRVERAIDAAWLMRELGNVDGERVMAAWGRWMQDNGPSLIEPGAPVGMSKTVSKSGVADNGGAD